MTNDIDTFTDMKACPLLALGDPGYRAIPGVKCKKNLCAWWDGDRCAMLSISFAITEAQERGGHMSYYRTCPNCGAHLDPGEPCDCGTAKSQTFVDLGKKGAAPSAANAEGGKQTPESH